MSEPISNATHYIIHSTPVDPLPNSTYGTSAPYSGARALERALAAAYVETESGRHAFVTARDDDSSILAVIPVAPYLKAAQTHVPWSVQAGVSFLCETIRKG